MSDTVNQINPSKLLHSKWTAVHPQNRERHHMVVEVEFDLRQKVIDCQLQAVTTGRTWAIDWEILKNADQWQAGWK